MKHSFLFLSVLTAVSAQAQIESDTTKSDTAKSETVKKVAFDEEVVVSATLTERPLIDVMASVDLISAEDIAVRQPTDLADMLNFVAGADVVRSGSRASNVSLFTRGTNTNQTLVLVNGERISSATLGSTQFNLIDPEQVSSMEYLRGSKSSIYGSEAIGGVLSINTLPAASDDLGGKVFGVVGSYDSQKIGANYANTAGPVTFSLAASADRSEGIDSTVSTEGENADKDGYERVNVNGALSWQILDNWSVQASSYAVDAKNDFDDTFDSTKNPYSEDKITLNSLGTDFDIGWFTNKLSISHSEVDSRQFNRAHSVGETADQKRSAYNTARDSVFATSHVRLPAGMALTVGLDAHEEKVKGASLVTIDYTTGEQEWQETEYGENKRDNKALFGQLEGDWRVVDINVGARRDKNSQFGYKTTGSSSLGFKIAEDYRVYASWSEGFKAPTFNDLYFPDSGNPELKPEESENFEVGTKAALDSVFFSAAIFRNEIKNLIQWAPNADGQWQPSNIGLAKVRGAEVSLTKAFNDFRFKGAYTFVDPTNVETGERLPYRSRKQLAMDLGYFGAQFNAGFDVKLHSDRTTSTGAVLGAYGIGGLYANWDINETVSLRARINNLNDKKYQLNETYNQEGRNGNIRFVVNF